MPAQKKEFGSAGRQVAATVARMRELRGFSLAEMSRRLDAAGRRIPVLGLSQVEKGERRVDVDDLVAISGVLGVSPLALITPAGDTDGEGSSAGIEASRLVHLVMLASQPADEGTAATMSAAMGEDAYRRWLAGELRREAEVLAKKADGLEAGPRGDG